jgi:hypothetical protein
MPTNEKMIDDPNVKLPASVRAAAQAADNMVRHMNGEQQPESEVTPQGNQDGAQQPELDASSLVATPVNPAPPPTQDDERPDEESWEHKYNSMHGRFKAASKQLQELQDTVSNLQNVIATMTAAPTPSADVPDISTDSLLTDEEVNDYGKDLLDVVGKKAYEKVAPLLKAQQDKIAQLEKMVKGVTGTQARNSQEKMLATMDKELSDWREINTNDNFLAWLALPDPYSGVIRHNMLKAAYTAGDASRTLAFFKGFLSEEAATKPVEAAEPGDQGTVLDRVPLADLAAPGKAKSAAAHAPAEKPIFTRAQISSFYADVAAGKFRGRDTEKNAVEAQIFGAQREGRIR